MKTELSSPFKRSSQTKLLLRIYLLRTNSLKLSIPNCGGHKSDQRSEVYRYLLANTTQRSDFLQTKILERIAGNKNV